MICALVGYGLWSHQRMGQGTYPKIFSLWQTRSHNNSQI
ncbi:hypothetical protein XBI1_280079 [Xenorhabdus bovienii str. Intermedium]|uniref:Uncharacterized protein n=1 Tax=Xenorhabdus bovienii str. Intermedium TaxID=1379677 RepID=A0A077QKX7_XENBV|nr:hypothetical protein XBI1_280079 [Xenorhabdus bovienii str. Intermedium]